MPDRTGTPFKTKLRQWFPFSRIDILLILAVFIVALLGGLFGEKIIAGEGLGFDGWFYGNLAKRFSPQVLFSSELTSYQIQRVVPAIIIHYGTRGFGFPLTTRNVIAAFSILDICMLTVGAAAWCLLCNQLKINTAGKLFGMLGIFASFGLTKWVSFYPVLTDVTAFAFGMGLIYAYFSNQRWLLFFLTVLGAFTWPTLLYEGVLFLLFPRNIETDERDASPAPYHLNIWLALISSVILGLALLYTYFHYSPPFPVQPSKVLLPLSILAACAFWFFVVSHLSNDRLLFSLRYWFKYFHLSTWLMTIGMVIAIKIMQGLLTTPDQNIQRYAMSLLITPTDMPGKNIVAHLYFVGPVILFLFFWWKSAFQFMRTNGLGFLMNTLLAAVFFLSAESRNLFNFLPILILPLAQAISSRKFRSSGMWVFACLTILLTRFWLPLNENLVVTKFVASLPTQVLGPVLYPEYLMNTFFWASLGPWTTHQWYAIELIIGLVIGTLLFFTLGKTQSKEH